MKEIVYVLGAGVNQILRDARARSIQNGAHIIINLFTILRVQPPYIATLGATPHLPLDNDISYQVVVTGDNFPAKPYTVFYDSSKQQFGVK